LGYPRPSPSSFPPAIRPRNEREVNAGAPDRTFDPFVDGTPVASRIVTVTRTAVLSPDEHRERYFSVK